MKSKNPLKEVTVMDVATANRPRPFFVSSKPTPPTHDQVAAANAINSMYNSDGPEKENEFRLEYNAKIAELNPVYSTVEPLGSYIVRFFVRTMPKKSKLILPVSGEILQNHKSGLVQEKARDPYRFSSKAVLVAVPEGEGQLKQGMIVQCVTPEPVGEGEQVFGYQAEYLHPSYEDRLGPKDCKNPHFGYAIIPRNWIKVILPDEPKAEVVPDQVVHEIAQG
jgi:hypothetical protein